MNTRSEGKELMSPIRVRNKSRISDDREVIKTSGACIQLTFPSLCNPQPKSCLSQFRRRKKFLIDLKHSIVERWSMLAIVCRREKMVFIPQNLTLFQSLSGERVHEDKSLLDELDFSREINSSILWPVVFDSLTCDPSNSLEIFDCFSPCPRVFRRFLCFLVFEELKLCFVCPRFLFLPILRIAGHSWLNLKLRKHTFLLLI